MSADKAREADWVSRSAIGARDRHDRRTEAIEARLADLERRLADIIAANVAEHIHAPARPASPAR